eukprot:6460234-Amphidinium_carterae.1
MDDISEWAQTAANRAQQLRLQVSSHIQESLPVVRDRASKASQAAADGAQAIHGWLEETAPARREALEQAQSRVSSWWSTVRATSAVALQKGQELAAEISSSETAQTAQARLTHAAGNARSSATEFLSNAAAALQNPQQEAGAEASKDSTSSP